MAIPSSIVRFEIVTRTPELVPVRTPRDFLSPRGSVRVENVTEFLDEGSNGAQFVTGVVINRGNFILRG